MDQVGLQNAEAAAQGGDLSQGGSGVLAACQEGEIPYSNRLDSAFSLTGRFEVAHGALFVTSGEDAASPLFAASPLTVTDTDIARGWQLWEVRTNCNVCYMMPEGATLSNRILRFFKSLRNGAGGAFGSCCCRCCTERCAFF